jgi:hypothetical protein
MLRKIVSTLALLCLLAVGNSAMAFNWVDCSVYHGQASDTNWFTTANWVANGGNVNGTQPPAANP